jgi:hypothetical protein
MKEITKERAQPTDLAVVQQHIHHGSKVVVMGSCHALQRLQTTTTARQTARSNITFLLLLLFLRISILYFLFLSTAETHTDIEREYLLFPLILFCL